MRGPIRYDAGQIVATRQAWWDRRWVTGAAIGLSGGIANGLFGELQMDFLGNCKRTFWVITNGLFG